MTAVVSFPQGVDEEQATEAGRQFFRAAFADNHDDVFAAHTDAENFHLHVVVQAAGHDGKQIRLNRAAIQDLRLLQRRNAARHRQADLAEKRHEENMLALHQRGEALRQQGTVLETLIERTAQR